MREDDVFTSRTLRVATFKSKGLEYVKDLVKQNIADLDKIIDYNEKHGYRFFRISSELFPHMENEKLGSTITDYNIDFTRDDLAAIGAKVRAYGHRVTFHPGQFAQLASPNEDVVARTVRDLTHHASIFEAMGVLPKHGSVMIIHGGGSYGDKPAALARWAENFRKLPENVAQYIALENDETQYGIEDLLPMCETLGVPLCVDFFHHKCMVGEKEYTKLFGNDAIIDRVMKTWTARGIKPKAHVSSQKAAARTGTHDDYIDPKDIKLPDVLGLCAKMNIDLMCECKQKDLCVQRILDDYFEKAYTQTGFYWRYKK